MDTNCKKYKFVNSQTGNTIYYHSVEEELNEAALREHLDKIKAQVASQNGLYVDIVYWEELKE